MCLTKFSKSVIMFVVFGLWPNQKNHSFTSVIRISKLVVFSWFLAGIKNLGPRVPSRLRHAMCCAVASHYSISAGGEGASHFFVMFCLLWLSRRHEGWRFYTYSADFVCVGSGKKPVHWQLVKKLKFYINSPVIHMKVSGIWKSY